MVFKMREKNAKQQKGASLAPKGRSLCLRSQTLKRFQTSELQEAILEGQSWVV